MGFVKDDQIVGLDLLFSQSREDAFPSQSIDADDHPVATLTNEGVRVLGVRAGNDGEREVE